MSIDTISPSQEFRKIIIAMLVFSDWLQRYGLIIQPEFFPVKEEGEVIKWINAYYTDYGDAPTLAALGQKLRGNSIVVGLDEVSDIEIHYATDVALEFAQTQAMKLAVMASVDDIKDGELHNIRGRVEEALAVGSDKINLGWELVGDIKQWLYHEVQGRRYPTGWPTVDNVLEGGLVGGEYGLVMAPPGMGKTTMLINIGFAMAGLIGAANVLHVTLEMPKQKILKRYAARLLGRKVKRSAANSYRDAIVRRSRSNLRARLRVVDTVRTVDDLRRLIDNLVASGFVTNALIVDYADLMIPTRRRKERRFELADLARELRMLGADYNIPVWSATQAGRHALYKETITLADIAEAIEKAAIADVILALCQTREEEKLQHGRLFGAKVRDAEARFAVPVKVDFSSQSILQRGKMSK